MLALIAGSLFAVAVVALVGAIFELRTGLRLLLARRFAGGVPGESAGLAAVEATIQATDGLLESPLLKRSCVLFHLVLLRRRLHETVGAGALFFDEFRPFNLVTDDGSTMAIDQKKQPVFILGLKSTEKALPFLPAAIAGLLIQRFGHKGHIWAEEHVVRATESTLDDGATVHALVEDGTVKLLSTTPLRVLGRHAVLRGGAGLVIAVGAAIGFWFTR